MLIIIFNVLAVPFKGYCFMHRFNFMVRLIFNRCLYTKLLNLMPNLGEKK